jgi:hypothetical protein
MNCVEGTKKKEEEESNTYELHITMQNSTAMNLVQSSLAFPKEAKNLTITETPAVQKEIYTGLYIWAI